jgi:hypothetical protein
MKECDFTESGLRKSRVGKAYSSICQNESQKVKTLVFKWVIRANFQSLKPYCMLGGGL